MKNLIYVRTVKLIINSILMDFIVDSVFLLVKLVLQELVVPLVMMVYLLWKTEPVKYVILVMAITQNLALIYVKNV